MNKSQDWLSLRQMRCECIMGILNAERSRVQPVEVWISARLDTRGAARSARLADTIDYARLLGEVRFILCEGRFQLLESAAEAIAAWIVAPATPDLTRASIEEVEVRLSKPEALDGVAVPEIRIRRLRGDLPMVTEVKTFGWVDIIFEAPECGVYRERLAPGAILPTHIHRVLEEAELILGDGLLLQGKVVSAGDARRWARGFPHRYENPTAGALSFLCIDRPRFRHDDEIVVDVPVAALELPPAERFF